MHGVEVLSLTSLCVSCLCLSVSVSLSLSLTHTHTHNLSLSLSLSADSSHTAWQLIFLWATQTLPIQHTVYLNIIHNIKLRMYIHNTCIYIYILQYVYVEYTYSVQVCIISENKLAYTNSM